MGWVGAGRGGAGWVGRRHPRTFLKSALAECKANSEKERAQGRQRVGRGVECAPADFLEERVGLHPGYRRLAREQVDREEYRHLIQGLGFGVWGLGFRV